MDRGKVLRSLFISSKIEALANMGERGVGLGIPRGDGSIRRKRRGKQTLDRPECSFDSKAFDFSELPAHKHLRTILAALESAGITVPFFQVHDNRASATTTVHGRHLINFASYDYLGLNGHPAVSAAAKAAIDRYGVSATASRLVAGERPIHRELETALARFLGTEAALAFVSGHATNVSVIGYLLGENDLVICDALSHNSVFEGIKLSGATRFVFPHNDFGALSAILNEHRRQYANALIVVEGLYSMDGDCPDMRRLLEIKRSGRCWLMVDEAHSVGVLGRTGRGIAEEQGIDPKQVEIWMGTLSKAMASTGGYIAGSRALIDLLRTSASGFVYSVALPPPLAAAALAAISLLEQEPRRLQRLRENGSLFLKVAREAGLDTGQAINGSVVPLMIGDTVNAVVLSNRLFDKGFNVLPIIYPAVGHKQARLRFFVTSEHTPEQIKSVITAVATALSELGRRSSAAVI
jgi:8-amino-7-oxononanoate synthase